MRMARGVRCGRKRDNFGAELSRIGCSRLRPAGLAAPVEEARSYPAVIKSIDCLPVLTLLVSPQVATVMVRARVWIAAEQGLSDGWGCTVRNRYNHGPQPRVLR